jgi:hypothetical protein
LASLQQRELFPFHVAAQLESSDSAEISRENCNDLQFRFPAGHTFDFQQNADSTSA